MEFTMVPEDLTSNRINGISSPGGHGRLNESDRKRLQRPYQSKTFKVEIGFAAKIPAKLQIPGTVKSSKTLLETYPSKAIRAELSEMLDLTDRQLQMWFCHRRLKDKQQASGGTKKKPRASGSGGWRNLTDSHREDLMVAKGASDHSSRSASRSGSGPSRFDNGDGNANAAHKKL